MDSIDNIARSIALKGSNNVSPSGSDLLVTSGCYNEPSIVYNAGGTITLGAGLYRTYKSTDFSGIIVEYNMNGLTLSITDGIPSYIVFDYNNGSPVIRVETDLSNINYSNIFPIYTVTRHGDLFSEVSWNTSAKGLANKLLERNVETRRFERVDGLSLGEVATRTVIISSGNIWQGANKIFLDTCNSSTGGFQIATTKADGTWTGTVTTQYDNLHFDNGHGTTAVSTGNYIVNWIFRIIGQNQLATIFLGNADYDLNGAKTAQLPSNIPLNYTTNAMLIGRIIVQKGASSATSIDCAFATQFVPSVTTNHEGLTGLQGGNLSTGLFYHSNQPINTTNDVTFESVLTNTISPPSNSLYVDGDIQINGTNTVGGESTLQKATSIQDTLTVSGITTINNNVAVSGNETIGGTLNVSGVTTINNNANITGNETVDGTLGVTGIATLNNNLIVNGTTVLNSSETVNGVTNLNDNALLASGKELRFYNTAKTLYTSIDSPLRDGNLYPDFRVRTKSGAFYVDKDGNFGNTLNPQASLHINGSGIITGNLQVQGTVTYYDVENLSVKDKNIYLLDTDSPHTDVLANGGGVILRGTTDKSILWNQSSGNWELNTGLTVNSIIKSTVGTSLTLNGSSTSIGMQIAGTTIATLTETGLGIGNISPNLKLIVGSGTITPLGGGTFVAGLNGNLKFGSGGIIEFPTNNSVASYLYTNSSNDFQFQTGANINMAVTSSGFVGIGVTSPAYKLHVYNAGQSIVLNNGTATTTGGGAYGFGIGLGAIDGSVGNYSAVCGGTSNNDVIFNAQNNNAMWLQTAQAYPIHFSTYGSERMRITSAGSLLIGTIVSSGAKFGVKVGTDQDFSVTSTNGVLNLQSVNDAWNAWKPFYIDGSIIALNANGGGNVGVSTINPPCTLTLGDSACGVWDSNYKVVDMLGCGFIVGSHNGTGWAGTGYGQSTWGNNSYYNGTSKAIGTGAASQILQGTGQIDFQIAPSVAAGATQTFISAMHINNNGDVNINGYTKLSSDAPAIKMKKLTGTTGTTVGSVVSIATGLTQSKILSFNVIITDTGSSLVPPNYALDSGSLYSVYIGQNGNIILTLGNSSINLLSRPFTVLIIYEA